MLRWDFPCSGVSRSYRVTSFEVNGALTISFLPDALAAQKELPAKTPLTGDVDGGNSLRYRLSLVDSRPLYSARPIPIHEPACVRSASDNRKCQKLQPSCHKGSSAMRNQNRTNAISLELDCRST